MSFPSKFARLLSLAVLAFALFISIDAFAAKVAKAIDSDKDQDEQATRDVDGKVMPPRAKDNFVNARVSPLGLLIGYFNVDLEFKLTNQWSLGPTVSYWGFDYTSSYYTNDKIRATSTSFGARANWSQNGTYKTGLYVSPIFQYRTGKASGTLRSTGETISASGSTPIITGLVGYHWFGRTLNMSLGGGYSFGTSDTTIDLNDGTSTSHVKTARVEGLAIDFMVGYVF